jgi:nitrogen regulatory protein P-II 1
MKMIIAIIQPEKLNEVKEKLFNAEVHKMTVSRVHGCGQQKGFQESYRGQIHSINLIEKVRIEIAVNDEFVDETVKTIVKAAKSGTIGDGKIFIMPMEECIRIRTDETGEDAIG